VSDLEGFDDPQPHEPAESTILASLDFWIQALKEEISGFGNDKSEYVSQIHESI
jgi:hypothetical protein